MANITLPSDGQTGWGTVLSAAITAINTQTNSIAVRVADYFPANRVEGTTDDLPAYTAALAALPLRGGSVLVDTNTWVSADPDLFSTTKTVNLTSSSTRQGSLNVLNSVPTSAPLATLLGHPKPTPWSAGLRHSITNLRINGNNRVVRIISLINAHAMLIQDNQIIFPANVTGSSCIYLNDGGEGISWENKVFGNRIEAGSGDTEANWGEYGIDVRSSDNHFSHNVILRARTAHIYNLGGNNFYFQNHAFYGPNHFVSYGTYGSTWIGNEADGPTVKGFQINAHNSVVIGNRIFWVADIPDTFVAGIEVPWAITNSTITGNVVHADSDTSGRLTADNRIKINLIPAPSTIINNNPGASVSTGLGLGAVGRIQTTYADGTPSGGNPRGGGAQDLQFLRTSANQVVSSASGFAAGARNLVSGNLSAAIGELHNVTGVGSIVTGRYGLDNGTNAARVHAGGRFSSNGDMQTADYIHAAVTTSTTKTRLTTNADTVSNNTTVSFTTSPKTALFSVDIMGLNKDTGDVVQMRGEALITKGATAASTVLVGTAPVTIIRSSGTVTGVSGELLADTSRGGLTVNVTAPNTNTWRWTAHIKSIEMS